MKASEIVATAALINERDELAIAIDMLNSDKDKENIDIQFITQNSGIKAAVKKLHQLNRVRIMQTLHQMLIADYYAINEQLNRMDVES